MKKELSLRAKTLIGAALFAVIFSALTVIASFYDLEISKILTKNALRPGEYISYNGFGLFFEAIGSAPIFAMVSIGAAVWFWWAMRRKKYWLCALMAVASVVGLFLVFNEIFNYVCEAMAADVSHELGGIAVSGEFSGKLYLKFVSAVLALISAGLLLAAWKHIKPENNDKLFKWFFVIIGVAACYLIINFVKGPVGRMRFRAMNAIGDTNFSNYTDWWVSNGKRSVAGLPSDSCKSFPSGHTFSAAVIYTVICLPDMLEGWNKKWIKCALWGGAITYTGLVAISRIVVGAHFMSDVLFGGTISFLAMLLMRELIIFKGAHLKAVFKKKTALPECGACCQKENAADAETAAAETQTEN